MSGNDRSGWELRELGRGDGRPVLLLPGMMCTAAFYEDVAADPRVRDGDVRFVAATPPGFGGLPVPAGFSPRVESYAQLTADLATELGCETVVGHSYFANVGIEMAASGLWSGQLVLLSPCMRADDEESDLKTFNRIARIPGVGRVFWALFPRMIKSGMKGKFPAEREDALIAEMRKIEPGVTRKLVRHYFDHLQEHGSQAPRLCESGVPALVVRGDGDEIGLTDEDRARLEACPTVEVATVADAKHFVMLDQPRAVVDVLLQVRS